MPQTKPSIQAADTLTTTPASNEAPKSGRAEARSPISPGIRQIESWMPTPLDGSGRFGKSIPHPIASS